MKDLRTYLSSVGDHLLHISREVDPYTQLGALCSQSERPLLFENIRGYPDWRICDILVKTRRTQALALDTTEAQVLSELARRFSLGPQPTRLVETGPVKERIVVGEAVDLRALPIAIHTEGDSGPYIGGGMAVTKDPDTGIQNVAFLRVQVNDRQNNPFSLGGRHNWEHYRKYEERGEAMPMAMVLGHHPAYEIAANYSGRYGVDEFELAGALLGETVEMVKCETIDLLVPAHAEIVIEGVVPPHERELEGPFGEFPGYKSDEIRPNPVWRVTAITMRHDAIYRHVQATVVTDHQRLVALPMEAGLYERVRDVGGKVDLHDVHVPPWAGNFLAVIQLTAHFEGQVKDVLLAGMSSSYLHPKILVAVDDDVDIYDGRDILWAISTRVNPATDVIVVPGTRNHRLDISIPEVSSPGKPYQRLGGKIGIDATKPSTYRPEQREHFDRARPMGTGMVWIEDFVQAATASIR